MRAERASVLCHAGALSRLICAACWRGRRRRSCGDRRWPGCVGDGLVACLTPSWPNPGLRDSTICWTLTVLILMSTPPWPKSSVPGACWTSVAEPELWPACSPGAGWRSPRSTRLLPRWRSPGGNRALIASAGCTPTPRVCLPAPGRPRGHDWKRGPGLRDRAGVGGRAAASRPAGVREP